ncbi:hypothetical protein NY547_04840 [Cnuibacter physcomitrellae]|uniref:hypothetical protein n=1 Tax=Cnuibacter physcomitrellae TaxID=1619308 RepID=UPI00217576A1|nr:hypothetical protein [Cnuibacter physcomitrellae]MCS5496565.1 hypothetical protein [Cnuibacter physcomitrellae]
MQPTHHIRRLLNQSDRLTHGAFELEVLESARGLAHSLGDDELIYATELRLSSWAMLARDDGLRLESFGRCLTLHRADPLRFPTSVDDLDLLWDYATIPRALAASHRVSAATIQRTLDEMVDVYSAAGADLAPCFLARYEWSLRSGGGDAAARERFLRSVEGRPGVCCRGCVHAVELRRHLVAGREAAAVAELEALRLDDDGCPTEPEAAAAALLLPLVRQGRTTTALQLSDELGRSSTTGGLSILGARIGLSAVVSDLEDGLSLAVSAVQRLARHERSTEQVVDLLVGLGGLLDALTRAGRGSAAVPFAEHPAFSALIGPRVGAWTTAGLGRAVWARARDLAGRLDSRDGVTASVARVERDRATGHGPRTVIATRAALPRGSGAARPDEDILPDTPASLTLAREHASAGRVDEARRLIDEGLLCADRDERATLLGLRVRLLVDQGALRAAEEELERRLECLVVDDLDDEAELDLQLGLLLFGGDAPDALQRFADSLERSRGLGLADPVLARLLLAYGGAELKRGRWREADRLLGEAVTRASTAHPSQQLRARALLLRARARGAAGDHRGALTLLDDVLVEKIDRGIRAAAHLHRSHAHLALGSADDGVAEADRALAVHTELGDHDGMIDTCGLLAALLTDAGQLDGAVEARRTAARIAVTIGRPDALAARFELVSALVLAGRGDEARAELEGVLEHAARSEHGPSTAEVLWLLGRACRDDDDDAAAYCAWSVALEHIAAVDAATDAAPADTDAAAIASAEPSALAADSFPDDDERMRRRRLEIELALGELLADQGSEEAVDLLDAARASAIRLGDPDELVEVRLRAARALAALGDRNALQEIDAVATVRAAVTDRALRARTLEARARVLDDLGDEDAAIEAARVSADEFTRIGEPACSARLRLFAGRMLMLVGRPKEARAELVLAAAAPGPDGRAAEQELARLDGREDAASGEPSTAGARPG